MSVLVKPIEQTYKIGDAAFAAIAVSSFFLGRAVVYYIGGVLADSVNRRNLILASGIAWSVAAGSIVFAAHPWQLFTARLCGGLTMAVGGAAVASLAMDSFTRDRRTFAISLFGVGNSIGVGLGLALCASLLKLADRCTPFLTRYIQDVQAWQVCFLFNAVLGLMACALLITVSEPSRLDSVLHEQRSVSGSLRTFITYIRQHGLLWVGLTAANLLMNTVISAVNTWQPTLANRVYHISVADAAAVLGVVITITSIAARLVAGSIAQILINRSREYLIPVAIAMCPALAVGFVVTFPLVHAYTLSVVLMAFAIFAESSISMFHFNAVQDTVPNEVRGQIIGVSGLTTFTSQLIGSLGFAIVSDHFFGGGAGLRYAFALCSGICTVLALIACVLSISRYRIARHALAQSLTTVA